MEQLLKDGKFQDVGKVIKSKIDKFAQSNEYKRMADGEAYYKLKNTEIMKRTKRMRLMGQLVNDPWEANHKLPSGYMRTLVDQKVNFSINSNMKLKSDSVDIERIYTDLGRRFDTKLKAYAKEASKTGRASFYPMIKDGKFDYKVLKSRQLIIEEEDGVIQYAISFDDFSADLMTQNSITTFVKKDGEYIIEGQPRPNVLKKTVVNGAILSQEAGTWGKVPLTLTFNNDEHETDLEAVKPFIDIYDIINSDFANNLDDFQDIYWILENFQGESIEDFVKQVKLYKTLKVGEGGSARPETIQIPVEAREKMLTITEDNIYKFGFGYNTNKVGDGNVTNVVIRSRYEPLNLKANDFEQEMREGVYQLLDFLNQYYIITNQQTFNPYDVDIVFERTMVINNLEASQLANESLGFLSEQTRLANDPRVTDVDKEIELMQEARDANPIRLGDAE